MTTYTSSSLANFTATTTAGIQNVMTSVDTLMLNSGWVQASDTGQMVISSVTYNGTSGSLYGYRVYYLNDSQHSTYPIYMRAYWRMYGTNTPGLAITLGHATDGAGNITGFKVGSDTQYLHTGGTTGWGLSGNASYACALDGYSFWTLCARTNTSDNTPVLMLAREWDDSTGAVKSGGNYTVIMATSAAIGNPYSISVNRANSTSASSSYFCLVPGVVPGFAGASRNPGTTTDVFRSYFNYGTTVSRHGGLVTYYRSEITAGSTFSAQPLTGGSARTFLPTGIGEFAGPSTSEHCLAALWE